MITRAAFLLLLAFDACSTPEEKLATTKRELRGLEDGLFEQYGGSQLANEIDANARQGAATDGGSLGSILGQAMGNTARELDRATFINDCVNVGKGERVPFLTDKGRAFFAKQETVDACASIAEKTEQVKRLAAEIAAAGGTPNPERPVEPGAAPQP